MNISLIDYIPVTQCKTIKDLVSQGEIREEEAIIFEKMMGLKNAIRTTYLTHEVQLSFLLERFFIEHIVNKEKIRYCFYAHTAEDISPYGCQVLFNVLRKNNIEKTNFMGVSLHKCASPFQLFFLSQKLLLPLASDESIMILISDITFTPILRHIPGSTILSDGALVMLLKKDSDLNIIQDLLIKEMPDYFQGMFGNKNIQLSFQEDYVKSVINVIDEIITRNHLSLEQLSAIFPHNVNVISWKRISDGLGFPIKKIFLKNVSNNAHQFGIDPFLNLSDGIQHNFIKKGDFYLLVSVGLGASIGVALMKY